MSGTATPAIFLEDRARFDDLLDRLATIDDGIVQLSRREIVTRLRSLLETQRLVNERCLFLALAPGGTLLLLIRRYYDCERKLDAALDLVAATSPRNAGYQPAVDAVRAAVDELFEMVQVPLARLAGERLDAGRLERLEGLAKSLRDSMAADRVVYDVA